MPELPEVETTRQGILPFVEGKIVKSVIVRQPKLRWPIPGTLSTEIIQQRIIRITRRGKYLLFDTKAGTLMIHLGMSGSLRVLKKTSPVKKHDHVDFIFSGATLRYHDPRRFGSILWFHEDPILHPLLRNLGLEPLTPEFTGHYLWEQSRKRSIAVKPFIMNAQIVVGVGNIYATEALFLSGIRPTRAASKISLQAYKQLANNIKKILEKAIKQGGSTLRDFVSAEGKPGYFAQQLQVYGRDGLPCYHCGTLIKVVRQGQRSSAYCPICQK